MLYSLALASGGLDVNSPYAYLLFSHYFSNTCIVAESDDGPAGFVLGFRPPAQPETLFVWQITTAPEHRGQGIGVEMLAALLERLADDGVNRLEATVTPSNEASQKMFQAVARRFGARYDENNAPLFSATMFPGEEHEEERLIQIGPINIKAREQDALATTGSAKESAV